MNIPIDWLLEGPSYIQYRTRLDLLGHPETDPEVQQARRAMLEAPAVIALVDGLQDWPAKVLNSHKSAGHPMHQLNFLVDLGLRAGDPGMDAILQRVMAHQDPRGPFQVLMNIPTHFGGTGEDMYAWGLCDAPNLVYALCKAGLTQDAEIRRAVAYLMELARPNGFPCAGAFGKFRGPGRKEDPCPYATLAMLKVLALDAQWRDSPAARQGAEALLSAWSQRREQHAYMFYMGTDFCKLKAPLVWYDIVHVLSVLADFPWLHGDPRLKEMEGIVSAKTDADGCFTPESVWQAWKDWEFGQKKVPSRWLTLVVHTILKKIG